MTEVRTIDVSGLKPYDISTQHPLWWGQFMFVFIEGTMFAILIAAYFYVRLRMDVWPPPVDQFPGRLLPTLALIPLILSCIGTYWASEAAKKNSRSGMIGGLALNLILAGIALWMRIVEWHSLNFNWMAIACGVTTAGHVLWAVPSDWRRTLGRWSKLGAVRASWVAVTAPLTAWWIHAAAIWAWHMPPLMEAALRSDFVHSAQHVSFLLSALLFW
jgi:hypothetical protein